MRKLKYAYYHLSRSIKCSFDGLLAAYKSEVAFRQDLVICSCLFVFALFCPVAFFYKMLMLLSLFFILFSELINTAIETTIDRISPEIHPLSKKAKDIGSAIVFISFAQMIFIYSIAIFLVLF